MSIVIRGEVRCHAPVSHNEIGSNAGNVTTFRRMDRIISGRKVGIPALSAGSLRGNVRRLLCREMFEACGISRETMGSPAWDRLYAALANGGTIEGAETVVKPDAIRARRAAIPVLSLLGAALYSSNMSGRLKAGHAWLRCQELGSGLPESDQVQEVSTVRLPDREEHDPAVSGVGPMPTTVEMVLPGAVFDFVSSVDGELEASAWAHGLDLVAYVGGKSGAGAGSVTIHHDGDGTLYVEWLKANTESLRASLLQLAEELTPSKAKGKKGKKGDEEEG